MPFFSEDKDKEMVVAWQLDIMQQAEYSRCRRELSQMLWLLPAVEPNLQSRFWNQCWAPGTEQCVGEGGLFPPKYLERGVVLCSCFLEQKGYNIFLVLHNTYPKPLLICGNLTQWLCFEFQDGVLSALLYVSTVSCFPSLRYLYVKKGTCTLYRYLQWKG